MGREKEGECESWRDGSEERRNGERNYIKKGRRECENKKKKRREGG